ncbi:MAG: hypothetical protein ABIY55_10715 [Kofleriaceae bacterium]
MVERLVLAVIGMAPALASAAPNAPTNAAIDRGAQGRLALTLGLLTPTGEIGVEYTQRVLPYLEIGAGGGLGVFGAQASLMPRLRAGDRNTSLTLGAGVSGGPFHEQPILCFDDCGNTETTVLWANLEIGFDFTSDSGVSFRVYGGAGDLIAHGSCTGPDCDRLRGTILPYVGIAVGHTL